LGKEPSGKGSSHCFSVRRPPRSMKASCTFNLKATGHNKRFTPLREQKKRIPLEHADNLWQKLDLGHRGCFVPVGTDVNLNSIGHLVYKDINLKDAKRIIHPLRSMAAKESARCGGAPGVRPAGERSDSFCVCCSFSSFPSPSRSHSSPVERAKKHTKGQRSDLPHHPACWQNQWKEEGDEEDNEENEPLFHPPD